MTAKLIFQYINTANLLKHTHTYIRNICTQQSSLKDDNDAKSGKNPNPLMFMRNYYTHTPERERDWRRCGGSTRARPGQASLAASPQPTPDQPTNQPAPTQTANVAAAAPIRFIFSSSRLDFFSRRVSIIFAPKKCLTKKKAKQQQPNFTNANCFAVAGWLGLCVC